MSDEYSIVHLRVFDTENERICPLFWLICHSQFTVLDFVVADTEIKAVLLYHINSLLEIDGSLLFWFNIVFQLKMLQTRVETPSILIIGIEHDHVDELSLARFLDITSSREVLLLVR